MWVTNPLWKYFYWQNVRLSIGRKVLKKAVGPSWDISDQFFFQEFPNGPVTIICILLLRIIISISSTHKPYLTNYSHQIETSQLSCRLNHLIGFMMWAMSVKMFFQQGGQEKWYFSINMFTSFFSKRIFSSHKKPVCHCKQQFSTLSHTIPLVWKKLSLNKSLCKRFQSYVSLIPIVPH